MKERSHSAPGSPYPFVEAATLDRAIPSDVVEQWMTHLRLQRSRARDAVFLIESGATLHDGRDGKPMYDATHRWLSEQREIIAEVDRLVALYDGLNAKH